ncbi:nitrile hydratase accessory protein [Pararhizobium sp.]|uniref:nitrile hydratase accessory protein n=1 Tax=Pararhizobium sp. TaxID=1977563 RepID=UPI00271DD9A4|nr:nitrile hydratase accessory protein [Pararhizobium sp.]MDO9418773.1 nitrile hydratase accessory protein [Pararhizobium sp.]
MSACEPVAGLVQSPGLPVSAEGAPVFAEPWHAEAFAMAVVLNEKGVFTWGEWAQALSAELHVPGARDDAGDYFDCWVAALSKLVTAHAGVAQADLEALTHSWQRAAEATPHGMAIMLENDPQRSLS